MISRILKIFKRYGALGSCRLIRDLAITKMQIPNARILRYPFYIRKEGELIIGDGFTTGVGFRLDIFDHGCARKPVVCIGKRVEVNDYVHIGCVEKIMIGDDCLVASRVVIIDHDHGDYTVGGGNRPTLAPAAREIRSKPITIGRNVWIGEGAAILKGTVLGDGVVVGANAVVRGIFPEGCVIGGNPAVILKTFEETTNQWRRVERPK
jgi:lipopolysaccharide O-acetyltransferase